MRVKIWGARGSLPAPKTPQQVEERIRNSLELFFDSGFERKTDIDAFLSQQSPPFFGGFGGNTPCVEIQTTHAQIAIDGGSGLRLLGYELMRGPCGRGQGEVHLFFTHFHWDHLIGLPFFTPFFIPGNTIHVYSVQPELADIFKTVFKKPYFPLNLEQLGAKIEYHILEPRVPFALGDMQITPYLLDHPDPCWGYRVSANGRTLSYCVDTEATRTSRAELGEDLPLYQNTDVMIFDAQYTLMEAIEKVDWGHAAASLGLDIAMREGIPRVYFMHHDPASTDEKIAGAENQARRYYDSQMKINKKVGALLSEVEWSFIQEGLVIDV